MGHVRALNFAFDQAPKRTPKGDFVYARAIEKQFAAKLKSLARHIADLLKGVFLKPGMTVLGRLAEVRRALTEYANAVEPWAEAVVRSMHARSDLNDRRHWRALSNTMGRALHDEIANAPTGDRLRLLMSEQVALIKSMPLDAAQWVHDQTMASIEAAARPSALVEGVKSRLGDFAAGVEAEIRAKAAVTGKPLTDAEIAAKVAKRVQTRAVLIARTETARTAAVLTQTRAEYLGSPGYFWHSARDATVRPTHRELDKKSQAGLMFSWSDPPVCDVSGDREYRSHPGQIFNCRCWAVPVIPS